MNSDDTNVTTWPETIYLVAGYDGERAPFDEHTEVTWCADGQSECDVRYVRYDIAEQAKGQAAPVLAVEMPEPEELAESVFGFTEEHMNAHGVACAEEARREVLANTVERQAYDAMKAERDRYRAALDAAQRTAGGEAEKVTCAGCKGTGDTTNEFHQSGGCSDCNGKGYDWEPVAEAAAQADGKWRMNETWNQYQARKDAAPTAQATLIPVNTYTCIGKGGSYRLLGLAKGSGTSKLLDDLMVYQDIATGALYFRTPDDFNNRMEVTL